MATTNNYVHPDAEIVGLDPAMVICESQDKVDATIDGYTKDTPVLEF